MCVRQTVRVPQAETNLLSFSLPWHLHCFRTPALKSDKYHTAPLAVFISREICGEGNGTPLQYFCLENPMDGGAWWAIVHRVARVGHD